MIAESRPSRATRWFFDELNGFMESFELEVKFPKGLYWDVEHAFFDDSIAFLKLCRTYRKGDVCLATIAMSDPEHPVVETRFGMTKAEWAFSVVLRDRLSSYENSRISS